MTPEEGYNLARYQLTGKKVIMGPTDSKIVDTKPLSNLKLHKLPGDFSWIDRELRLRLGFVPSLWTKSFACAAMMEGHNVTYEEWIWLQGKSTLIEARKWLNEFRNL